MPNSLRPQTVAHEAPLGHGILQARMLEWVSRCLLQGNLPDQGTEPGYPALQAESLPSEPPGKLSGINIRNTENTEIWR